MTFINRFGGSCGTFGEEKKTHCHQQHLVSSPPDFFLIKKKERMTMGWMLA
jgi:hypothetical protein